MRGEGRELGGIGSYSSVLFCLLADFLLGGCWWGGCLEGSEGRTVTRATQASWPLLRTYDEERVCSSFF